MGMIGLYGSRSVGAYGSGLLLKSCMPNLLQEASLGSHLSHGFHQAKLPKQARDTSLETNKGSFPFGLGYSPSVGPYFVLSSSVASSDISLLASVWPRDPQFRQSHRTSHCISPPLELGPAASHSLTPAWRWQCGCMLS